MVDSDESSNTQALIRVTTNVLPTTQGNMNWMQRVSRKVTNVRISGFPSSYSAEQVLAYLRERVIEGGGSGVDIHQLTVASDVIFDDYGVAVASFFNLPPELPIPGSLGDMWFADTAFHGLTTLYSPADGKATVDIVAIHGLGSHPFETWSSARYTGKNWLRDFLPKTAATARIMIYGYDSVLHGSKSFASIPDLAKGFLETLEAAREEEASERPLILVGHDVGGLIIKQCLLEAINREQLDIINSTYGLIFFGVPTRGLDDTSISTMVQGQGNEDMIRSVASSCANGYLVELNNNFGRHFNHKDSRIVSFYETRMTPTYTQAEDTRAWQRNGPHVMTVTQSSATDHWKHSREADDMIPLDSNHIDLVKFDHPRDPKYLTVQRRIHEMIKAAPKVVKKRFPEPVVPSST